METALNQTMFLTQAQALLGKAISEHTTQRNAEVKSIINRDKWQGWQNWTDEKLATKLTKDDQHTILLLPAR